MAEHELRTNYCVTHSRHILDCVADADERARVAERRLSDQAEYALNAIAKHNAEIRAIVESSDSYVPQDVAAECMSMLKVLDEPGKPNTLLALVERAVSQLSSAKEEVERLKDAAEMLWVVLANVSGGDWTKQSAEWQEAAAKWRDSYFVAAGLKTAAPSPEGKEPK